MIADIYEAELNSLIYPKRPKRLPVSARATHADAVRDYRRRQAEIIARFREKLGAELGVLDHPKFSKLWDLAWEDGHSAGLAEVERCARNLVELILP